MNKETKKDLQNVFLLIMDPSTENLQAAQDLLMDVINRDEIDVDHVVPRKVQLKMTLDVLSHVGNGGHLKLFGG